LLACLIVAPQRATMSQQSSLTQSAHSVRQVLTAYRQWEELAMTKILAYVIGVGGVAMIALGLWGFYVLTVGELRLREYILAIQTIAVGFALIGVAQGLRLLLALVALQPGH
jgi:hypothetical protein